MDVDGSEKAGRDHSLREDASVPDAAARDEEDPGRGDLRVAKAVRRFEDQVVGFMGSTVP